MLDWYLVALLFVVACALTIVAVKDAGSRGHWVLTVSTLLLGLLFSLLLARGLSKSAIVCIHEQYRFKMQMAVTLVLVTVLGAKLIMLMTHAGDPEVPIVLACYALVLVLTLGVVRGAIRKGKDGEVVVGPNTNVETSSPIMLFAV